MVIVKLIGGLGNQLFQYAAGRQVAHINKSQLKLDISGFENYKLHAYSLFHFNIVEDIATSEEIAPFYKQNRGRVGRLWWRLQRQIIPYRKQSYRWERFQSKFDAEVLANTPVIYLDGYWQNPQYFMPIEDIIRQEFTVKTAPDDLNLAAAAKIKATNAICVHIRRGDYVNNSATNNLYGTCSLDYYYDAAKIIANSVVSPHFFVFSDEPAWARENLRLSHPTTFVDQNGPDKNYEDLRLMMLCQHFIAANSTFSWWGAWLGRNPNKIVIVPKEWFSNPSIVEDYNMFKDNLIPKNWLKI